ncbi:hypothetical protein DFH28DRAFT_1082585 [Melampsora americana]|nr:hypothetical protein DFH28DRAFT_1082585 [Melampsora americana]
MNDNLRSWLVQQNHNFIEAFFTADLKDWVLCVGNEAGDLDTLSSSIAFAYLSSFDQLSSIRYIPIQLTPSSAFQLRAENVAALKDAMEIDHESGDLQNDLICSDTLDFSKFTPYGAKYALVDHNQVISSVFGHQAEVVAIIDHHEPAQNNSLYLSAQPRIIQVPTGSCASLVVNHFSSTWQSRLFPIGLADLLLSAIVIDTSNLKLIQEGGKATESDLLAREFLIPRSRFAISANSLDPSIGLQSLYKNLSTLKDDVTRLNSTQLLQRDYKEYEVNGWRFGLSSVPLSLSDWVRDKESNKWKALLTATNEYGASKSLDTVGILTNKKLKKKELSEENQSRHSRELLILIRNESMLPLYDGLENPDRSVQQILDLSNLIIDQQNDIDAFVYSNSSQVKIWKVGNSDASRKQVAPILTNLVSQLNPKPVQ